MDKSDTVEETTLIPNAAAEEEHSRINRCLRLPSFYYSRFASCISIFCIGLVSGAAGGLLLGATAVIVLQSLERLADNRLLMDQLKNYTLEDPLKKNQNISTDDVFNIYISLLVEEFFVFSSTLSLPVGIFIGLSTYALRIKINGEAAMGKALALAGTVCLMGVTATGYLLGPALERFLTIISSVELNVWYILFIFGIIISFICVKFNIRSIYIALFSFCFFSPAALLTAFLIHTRLTTKLVLIFALIPAVCVVFTLQNTYDFRLRATASVPLMLIITDVFHFAGQPIVTLQSPANTSSVVLEGIFVGVLTTQLWAAAVGMSLFVSWQRGGAGKICASAAGSGGAVLGVIHKALPFLGPGRTIGALTGVAGAVGVSLAAAGAVDEHYGQAVDHSGLVGKLGVTAGAAAGAFLSCAHSRLSGKFMALCAATIPAGLFLYPLFLLMRQKFQFYLSINKKK